MVHTCGQCGSISLIIMLVVLDDHDDDGDDHDHDDDGDEKIIAKDHLTSQATLSAPVVSPSTTSAC